MHAERCGAVDLHRRHAGENLNVVEHEVTTRCRHTVVVDIEEVAVEGLVDGELEEELLPRARLVSFFPVSIGGNPTVSCVQVNVGYHFWFSIFMTHVEGNLSRTETVKHLFLLYRAVSIVVATDERKDDTTGGRTIIPTKRCTRGNPTRTQQLVACAELSFEGNRHDPTCTL